MNNERRPDTVRVYGWQWGSDEVRRSGVPWIGVFLVIFGILLLLEQVLPNFHFAGSTFVLIVGLVFLVRWAVDRSVPSLYAGAIITALAAPGVLEGLSIISGPGLGTLCLGIAFLAIAAVRGVAGAGYGWQAWIGIILTVIGGSQVARPATAGIIWPMLILALGVVVVLRGVGRR